jgi:hypothetical protein
LALRAVAASAAAAINSGSIGGSSGASRSKSRNCRLSCTPPSPSTMVWCSFWISGALAATQAIDDDELPQRPGAVERVARDEAGQIEQLAHRARLGQCHPAHVVAEVEVGVVDPHRRAQVHRRRLHTLAQARHRVGGALHAAQEHVEVRRLVEHGDVGERALRCGSFSRRHISPSASLILRSKCRSAMWARLPPASGVVVRLPGSLSVERSAGRVS